MDSYHTFFEDAALLDAERLIVFSPKERLGKPRRGRVIESDDLGCRDHHRIGIAVLLDGHQEGSAGIWPGCTEKVIPSGNGIRAGCQLVQRYRSTG
jgi:hypothetical protein